MNFFNEVCVGMGEGSFKCTHSGIKSSFLIWGFKINFKEKNHGSKKGKYGHFRYNEIL
jgi:hypothetical protein